MSLAAAAKLREYLDDVEVWDEIDKTIDKLISGYAATVKDAERYRHLRGKDLETIQKGGVFAGQVPQNLVLSDTELDEAVDQSIKYDIAMSDQSNHNERG